MSAAAEGAKLGSEAGSLLGPEGRLGGAIVGGIIGAAGIAGNLLRNRERARERGTARERQPLIRPNPLSGREVPQLRQRIRPVQPVEGRSTEDVANQAINRAATQTRQPRAQVIRARNIPRVVAGAAAAAGTAAIAGASQLPTRSPTPPPSTIPSGPTAPINPSGPPSPPPSPPVIVDSNPELETKEPEIPPDVISDHFKALGLLHTRTGNYRLPVFGRHDFVEWTQYTEGNAVAAQY